MQVKVVTSGCSFTHAPDSWANWLEQRYELFNVAEGGGGNEGGDGRCGERWSPSPISNSPSTVSKNNSKKKCTILLSNDRIFFRANKAKK